MRQITVALVVSVLTFSTLPAHADDDDGPAPKHVAMDDPRDAVQNTREQWEAIKHTSFDDAVAYAKRQQAKSALKANSLVTLPTGWKILPAGTQVSVGTLPFQATLFNGSVISINSGYATGPQSISVVSPASAAVTNTISIQNLFPSSAVGPGGDLYVSGGISKAIYQYNSSFQLAGTFTLPGFAHGLADYDARYLVATYTDPPLLSGILSTAHVVKIDATNGNIVASTPIGIMEPYSVTVVSGKVYVTVPAAGQVVELDGNLNLLKTLAVGKGPQSTCTSGANLYVVDMNSDQISVINTNAGQVTQTFNVNYWGQSWGTGPSSCATDGTNLYVTLSQVNAVLVLNQANGAFKGYIPAGWYPTAMLVLQNQLAIVSAKGIQPLRPNNVNGEYVLSLLQGTVGFVNQSDIAANLPSWTLQVLTSAPSLAFGISPNSQIQHVFFIVKENRTYDQILGDLGKGNGDASLTMFGNSITPIEHYLANEFVTLDNTYVDGEVSTTGHSVTSSGYASPYLQMLVSLDYSGRTEDSSANYPGGYSPSFIWDAMAAKNINYRIFGEAEYLQSLYWLIVQYFGPQSSLAGKVSYLLTSTDRTQQVMETLGGIFTPKLQQTASSSGLTSLLGDPSTGPAVSQALTGDNSLYQAAQTNAGFLAALVNYFLHLQLNYAPFDLNVSDLTRVAAWMTDFQVKDALGLVEPFQYMILPNDHTGGSMWTPVQYVAQNDAALDIILRTLAKSKAWAHSLVLVIEDDAQSGLDHVDGTRTTAFAVGPYVKRGAVVSDRYDQVSMLRTIGLLLGSNPVSTNDALATPMYDIFQTTATNGYDPPPVSTALAPDDLALYQQLLAKLGN
ncbi:MAG TPA: alkaline phosphatase family protein [Bryobacteraceae bacterium]|nr:alkaline phosphatase family protein [Bryobacteraceae bacterium]